MSINKFLEKTTFLIIITSLIVVYASAIFVYAQSWHWPLFGNPKPYLSLPFNQVIWWYFCIWIYISTLVSIVGFIFALVRLLINLIKKNSDNFNLLILTALTTFNLLDPFGVQNWFLD